MKSTKKTTEAPKKIPDTLITPRGRLSYPHLLERNTGGNYPSDKYETLLLIPKGVDISELEAAATKAMTEMFDDEFDTIYDLKNPPLRDGDEKGGEYSGHWILKAKSDNRPAVVGLNPKVIIDSPEEVYGGQWARLSLNVYAYKKPGNKGVAWGLKNVQIIGGGDPFGGGAGKPEDQFTEIEAEDRTNF